MSNDEHKDLQQLIAQLSQAAVGIEKDDLSALAKMHGWCESLAECFGPNGPQPDAAKADSARALVSGFEELILGTADDPDAALTTIVETIAALTGSSGKATPPPGPASPVAPAVETEPAGLDAEMTDDEVAARMSQVFDETGGGSSAEAATSSPSPAEAAPETSASSRQASTPVPQSEASEPSYEPEPLFIDEKELEFVAAFIEEAGEHIESIEAALLEVEQAPDDSDKINELFRPFHTIKGMAGFLNLRDVNCLTHEVETVLDQGRKGEREMTPGIIDLVFEVIDILKEQIEAIQGYVANPTAQAIPQPPVADMIDRLRGVVSGRIQPGAGDRQARGGAGKVGENLVEQGAVRTEAVEAALKVQEEDASGRKIGEVLMDIGVATPKDVGQALRTQPKPTATSENAPARTARSPSQDLSVRIETGKLDALVDMVGELVIAQTLISANPKIAEDPRLSKDTSQVSKIVRDVQEVAMSMRMIPIKSTFQKMARLVRDLSRKANKKVELIISGEETELDKNVIQQIGDPLVHMVRNAVDHGIEPPEARVAAGKPETGHVHLVAFHQGSNIVVEVHDDGKGLDPAVLIAKGIEKGIVQPEEELTEEQAYHLILAPGFSTAAKITDISGRGVGMDVVKRNIEQLRGRVDIASEKGRGSTFSIRLPLTLAIIDGMVIRVGVERFIVPTTAIEQALRPQPAQITSVQHKGEILQIRGKLLPLIQLGQMFGMTGRIDPCQAMAVIAHSDAGEVGLVVEELIGQQQVVIKSLGERFRGLHGISGAAILGDGRVGLILDASGVRAVHDAWQHAYIDAEPQPQPAEPATSGEAHSTVRAYAGASTGRETSGQPRPEPAMT